MSTKTRTRRSKSQTTSASPRPIVALRPNAPRRAPNHENIRLRAYQHFTKRISEGRAGDAVSDWLRAEGELRAEALPKGDAE